MVTIKWKLIGFHTLTPEKTHFIAIVTNSRNNKVDENERPINLSHLPTQIQIDYEDAVHVEEEELLSCLPSTVCVS